MKCPFMEKEETMRNNDGVLYTITVARDCMKDDCAIWDEYQLCCGIKVTLLAPLLVK